MRESCFHALKQEPRALQSFFMFYYHNAINN